MRTRQGGKPMDIPGEIMNTPSGIWEQVRRGDIPWTVEDFLQALKYIVYNGEYGSSKRGREAKLRATYTH